MGKIIIIAGPTGSGKSEIGLKLAQSLNGEIVNIDSVQLYKDFIIGSARPTDAEMQQVPHHLFGTIEPTEQFDAARYNQVANETVGTIIDKQKLPIFVGGTSLYITTLIHGLVDLPSTNKALRERLELLPTESLYEELKKHDLSSAEQIHAHDRVRIIRALEAGGAQTTFAKRAEHGYRATIHEALIIVPMWPRQTLYQRIDTRTKIMVEKGLVKETQGIIEKYGEHVPALKSIGYDEVINYLKGKMTTDLLINEVAQNTRRFAKRQMTWLRNEPLKRGWVTRPTELEPAVELKGDTGSFARPNLLKHFRVLDLDFQTLAANVQNELNQGVEKTTLWFINGPKVLK